MQDTTLYSVVIPVFNSKNTVKELFLRIKATFETLNLSFEIIFVEDGGKDDSWELIAELKKEHPSLINAIRLSKNFGQHNATLCGFNYARGVYVVTIDDDLQIIPETIPLLIDKMKETHTELVYGIYAEKKHHVLRNMGSNVVQKIFKYIFNTRGNISSYRLIAGSLCKKVAEHKQSFVFVDGLLHWHTSFIERVYVEHAERSHGRSNYTLTKLLLLAGNLFFNFTTLPLRLIVYFGAFCSITSFLAGFFFIVRKWMYQVPLGYTSIIVSVFFSTGLILLVIGVVGLYVSRIYTLQNDKPQYSVKTIL